VEYETYIRNQSDRLKRFFPLLLTQMGMAPSYACECGAEAQTVDPVVL